MPFENASVDQSGLPEAGRVLQLPHRRSRAFGVGELLLRHLGCGNQLESAIGKLQGQSWRNFTVHDGVNRHTGGNCETRRTGKTALDPSPTEDALQYTTVRNRIRLFDQRRKRTIVDMVRCLLQRSADHPSMAVLNSGP